MRVKTSFQISALILVICLKSWSCEAKTDQEIERDIDNVISKIDDDAPRADSLKTSLSGLKKNVKSFKGDNREKLDTAVTTLGESVPKLQSDDPAEVAVGCLDMLVGFADIAKPLAMMSPLFMIISGVIGFFTSAKTEESVGAIIKKALEAQRDKELAELASATKTVSRTSKAFLDGVKDSPEPLTPDEVSAVSANVPIYQGVKMISLAIQRIESAEPADGDEAKRMVDLLEATIELITFRDVILTDLYCQVSISQHSPNIASGINGVRKMSKDRFKQGIEKLLKGDEPKKWLFLSHLYPKGRSAQTKKIFVFLESLGVQDIPRIDDDISGLKMISPVRWPDYCMKEQSTSKWMMGNIKKENSRGVCNIKLTKLVDGYYTMLAHNNRLAYADSTYIMLPDPGEKGSADLSKFNFLPVEKDDKEFYVISSYQWPDKFAYMSKDNNGWVKFYAGDPDANSGTQAFWTLSDAA